MKCVCWVEMNRWKDVKRSRSNWCIYVLVFFSVFSGFFFFFFSKKIKGEEREKKRKNIENKIKREKKLKKKTNTHAKLRELYMKCNKLYQFIKNKSKIRKCYSVPLWSVFLIHSVSTTFIFWVYKIHMKMIQYD